MGFILTTMAFLHGVSYALEYDSRTLRNDFRGKRSELMRSIQLMVILSMLLCLPVFAGMEDSKKSIIGKWIESDNKSVMEFRGGSQSGKGFVSSSEGKSMVTSAYGFIDKTHFKIKEINTWKSYQIISLTGDRLEVKRDSRTIVYNKAKMPSWVSHKSQKGGFAALFPQAPVESGLPSNSGQKDRLMCAADNGAVFCSVIVEHYPAGKKSPEALIDEVYKREFEKSDVKTASRTFSLKPYTVKEYLKVLKGTGKVRIYADNSTVFIVMAAFIRPQSSNEDIDRFISSFTPSK